MAQNEQTTEEHSSSSSSIGQPGHSLYVRLVEQAATVMVASGPHRRVLPFANHYECRPPGTVEKQNKNRWLLLRHSALQRYTSAR